MSMLTSDWSRRRAVRGLCIGSLISPVGLRTARFAVLFGTVSHTERGGMPPERAPGNCPGTLALPTQGPAPRSL